MVRGARFSIYEWEGVVPRCECVRARDVRNLHTFLAVCRLSSEGLNLGGRVCRRSGWKCGGGGVGAGAGAPRRGRGHPSSLRPPCPRRLLIGFTTAGLRLPSQAERSAGERTGELCRGLGAGRRAPLSPRVPNPAQHRLGPALRQLCPAEDSQHQHGLLHRERLLQARRRHSRHPAGRSWCQCCRCQNPGEFPGPHGEEEDQKRRAWPEGPGPRGAWRSWGRPGRRGRLPQRRLGQVSRSFPSPGTR